MCDTHLYVIQQLIRHVICSTSSELLRLICGETVKWYSIRIPSVHREVVGSIPALGTSHPDFSRKLPRISFSELHDLDH